MSGSELVLHVRGELTHGCYYCYEYRYANGPIIGVLGRDEEKGRESPCE